VWRCRCEKTKKIQLRNWSSRHRKDAQVYDDEILSTKINSAPLRFNGEKRDFIEAKICWFRFYHEAIDSRAVRMISGAEIFIFISFGGKLNFIIANLLLLHKMGLI
jgi:hypothetical protein